MLPASSKLKTTFNKLASSVSSAFEFNHATLSGCVDIIVVKQPDGSYKSTPFHVRFGKMKVLKPEEKIVQIYINNQNTGLTMKLGKAGEGYFEADESQGLSDEDEYEEISPAQPQQAGKGDQTTDLFSPINVDFLNNKMKSDKSGNTPDDLEIEISMCGGEIHNHDSEGARKLFEKYKISSKEFYNTPKFYLSDTKLRTKVNGVFYGPDESSYILSNFLLSKQKKARNAGKDKNASNSNTKTKTLRPTKEMLQSMNLESGINTITYTINSHLQGSQTVHGHIYLWPHDARIIISDVDGTITRSDFLGQVLPMLGKDWSQPGIAPLYRNLRKNGYYLMYLTSRAIGQSETTKNFIYSIEQDSIKLPHGPVVMSPDRLIPSFKREVIYRRPELFKMATLKDILRIFPEGYSPFHAGFGNRDTDTIAYRSVGIQMENIFIVNPKGEIHQYHKEELKSYAMINAVVKEMFPVVLRQTSLNGNIGNSQMTANTFNAKIIG